MGSRSRLGIVLLVGLMTAACGSPSGAPGSKTVQVIAGENFWGSIAAQLGGSDVTVTSIVTNPNTDPHEYESSANDARGFATADYVILNGAGYDDWGQKLLSANPDSHRRVLTVADLLGKKPGDNPHFWYNPSSVTKVADAITAGFESIDSANANYYNRQRAELTTALQPYQDAIAQIKANHANVPVAATESIFVYLAQALGLNLISPPKFMQAISEGNDPPAQTVATFQNQLRNHQARLLVYNIQASSPITESLKQIATANKIPVVGISETIEPVGSSFQDWQVKQLQALQAGLGGQ
jgi:zinc/manganese transport system substrate-binding protein